MAFDQHKNFAYSLIATAPSPAASGTSLVVTAGQGTLFPAAPFNATVWATGTSPIATNAEIVRVTNVSTDTLTITRAQESSSARSIVVGDQIAATVTAKSLTDIENGGILLPGGEIGYDQITGNVTVSSTTEASGTTLITCSAHTFDGGPVIATFFAPELAAATSYLSVCLFDGATEIGRIIGAAGGVAHSTALMGQIRFTPSAGSHTFTVTAFILSGGTSMVIKPGAGGSAAAAPSFIRFTKV